MSFTFSITSFTFSTSTSTILHYIINKLHNVSLLFLVYFLVYFLVKLYHIYVSFTVFPLLVGEYNYQTYLIPYFQDKDEMVQMTVFQTDKGIFLEVSYP